METCIAANMITVYRIIIVLCMFNYLVKGGDKGGSLRSNTTAAAATYTNMRYSRLRLLDGTGASMPCTITQHDKQHLGHQLEGKMSCWILSLIDPTRFKYVHTPFKVAGKVDIELDGFFNLGTGRQASQLSVGFNDEDVMLAGAQLHEFNEKVRQNSLICDPQREYVVDNCWGLAYEEPFVSGLNVARHSLREQYNNSSKSKPNLGWDAGKHNVVVYISEDDARIPDTEKFYISAVKYFQHRYDNLWVWFESGRPDLPIHSYLQTVFGFCSSRPSSVTNFETMFHRMVMAEGLVFKPSNLGMSAALLSTADTVIVPMGVHGIHASLISRLPERFQQIDAVNYKTVGNLGYTNRELVNMVQPTDKAAPCNITQYGTDGLGHQLEGKLSCTLLSLVWPARFPYVHTPFLTLEHVTEISAAAVEQFTNVGEGYSTAPNGFIKLNGFNPAFRAAQLEEFFKVVRTVDPKCDPNRIYIVDNCWGLTYMEPAVSRIESVRWKLRANYLKTEKPELGFDKTKRNVVVHMRAGDSEVQGRFFGINETEFFIRGIKLYAEKFAPQDTVFWILTDTPTFALVNVVKTVFVGVPHVTIETKGIKDPLLTAFHRMVMADGMVMSPSSFSNAAAMLSAADTLVITGNDHHVHTLWMNQARFVKIVC
jgi:hypothetical protein